ncbi:MAG: hypothetical protein WA931_09680 [Rhodococcus sp. (in: high G+C Gram-positive bacteria)]
MNRVASMVPRPLSPRNVSFRDLQNTRVYGPFDLPAPDVAEQSLREFFASPRGRTALRHLDRGRSVTRRPNSRSDERDLLDTIVRRAAATEPRGLFDELMARPFADVPLEVTVTDRYVGVRPNHSFSDGTSGNAWVVAVISVAAGNPRFELIDDLATRWPLPRALVRAGFLTPSAVRGALATARRFVSEVPTAAAVPRPAVQTAAVLMDLEDLRRHAHAVSATDSPLSVASSLTLAVLRAASAVIDPKLDPAILMSFEGRRYIGSARGTSGNFAPAMGIGRLREDTWTPDELKRRISALVDSGAPLATVLRGALLDYRPHRAVRPANSADPHGSAPSGLGRPFAPGRAIALSHILPTPEYDDLPWSSETERCCMSAAVTPSGIGITVYTERTGGVLTMSVVDDSELMDVEAFLDAVVADVGARVHGRV